MMWWRRIDERGDERGGGTDEESGTVKGCMICVYICSCLRASVEEKMCESI